MLRDPCRFAKRELESLAAAPDGLGDVERWPLSTAITWAPAAAAWLGREHIDRPQTVLTVEIVEDSITSIVAFEPAADAEQLCEPRVEFRAQLRVHTQDGLVVSEGPGEGVSRQAAMTVRARLDADVEPAPAAQTERGLGVAVELPREQAEPAKVELLGHERRHGAGPSGRPFIAGGEVVLASSVSARPQPIE